MKMKVDRIVSPDDGSIIFTIRVSDPDDLNFLGRTNDMVQKLQEYRAYIDDMELDEYTKEYRVNYIIRRSLTELQSELIMGIVKDFENEIESVIEHKNKMVSQEILNWIINNQTGNIKPLLDELYHRKRYYFDNDPEKLPHPPQQREDVSEDEYEDDSVDDDTEY